MQRTVLGAHAMLWPRLKMKLGTLAVSIFPSTERPGKPFGHPYTCPLKPKCHHHMRFFMASALRDTRACISFTSSPYSQPKRGNHSPCIPLSFVSFSPSTTTESCFFPRHPTPPCREKASLTAVLLSSDINTMKEITANFYGLSHHEQ